MLREYFQTWTVYLDKLVIQMWGQKKKHFRYAKSQETLELRKHRKATKKILHEDILYYCVGRVKKHKDIQDSDPHEKQKNLRCYGELKNSWGDWWSVKTLHTFELHTIK